MKDAIDAWEPFAIALLIRHRKDVQRDDHVRTACEAHPG